MLKKILITGCEGQLGKALQTYLSDKYNLLSTSKKTNPHCTNNHVIKKMDIINRKETKTIIDNFKPNIIINCAAYSDVDGSEINKILSRNANVKGLKNIISCADLETFIIQISSDYVFDGKNGPYSETDKTFPVNYYGKTKLEAENVLRGSRHQWAILRPNVIYGDNLFCKANFFAWVYKKLIKKENVNIVTDQTSNPIYIDDFVNYIFQCILLKYNGVLHIGSDNCLSRYDFSKEIAKVFGLDGSLIKPVKTVDLMRNNIEYIAKRPKNSSLKIEKVEQELNIRTSTTLYALNRLKNKMNIL